MDKIVILYLFPLVLVPVHDHYFCVIERPVLAERVVDTTHIHWNAPQVSGTQTQLYTLMGTLKTHSNGPLYSNALIGTLTVDGWAVWYSEEGSGRARCTKWTAHPSMVSV